MVNPETKKHRRIYLVDSYFQKRFILRFCILAVLGGLLTVGIMYPFLIHSATVAIVNTRVIVKSTADFILPILIQTVMVVMIFVSLATIAVTLFISRKLSESLYPFKKAIEAMKMDDRSVDSKIRELNQLQDYIFAFNEMLDKMGNHINGLQGNCVLLQETLGNITENDLPENKRSYLHKLKNICVSLDKTVSRLKT